MQHAGLSSSPADGEYWGLIDLPHGSSSSTKLGLNNTTFPSSIRLNLAKSTHLRSATGYHGSKAGCAQVGLGNHSFEGLRP